MRILNKKQITSCGNRKGRNDLYEILEAGLIGGDPYNRTKNLINIENNFLIIGNKESIPKGDPNTKPEFINLDEIKRIFVVGAGKGIQKIAKAIEEELGGYLTGGHVIDKKGNEVELKKIGVTLGGHPVPDNECIEGCKKILKILDSCTETDLVFTIAGHGVSSLLSYPVEGVTLEDIRETIYKMQIERGVPTPDLCYIRNHLDLMKGGKVTKHIWPTKAIHLIAYDYDYEDLIFNNFWLHFLPDNVTSFEGAVNILKKWEAWDVVPSSVREFLLKADPSQEVLKPNDFLRYPFRIFRLAGNNAMMEAAKIRAEELGYKAYMLTKWPYKSMLQAEAKEAGKVLSAIANNIEINKVPFEPPCVLLSTGGMEVTVGEAKGIGGRNQEFSLSAALEIEGSKNIVIGSVDSDGDDGPGDQFSKNKKFPTLAGGMVDGYTAKMAKMKGIDIFEEINNHNATPVLLALDSGIIAEHNISLQDLTVIMVQEE